MGSKFSGVPHFEIVQSAFPTRKELSTIALDSFSNADPSSPVKVVQCVCSKEEQLEMVAVIITCL